MLRPSSAGPDGRTLASWFPPTSRSTARMECISFVIDTAGTLDLNCFKQQDCDSIAMLNWDCTTPNCNIDCFIVQSTRLSVGLVGALCRTCWKRRRDDHRASGDGGWGVHHEGLPRANRQRPSIPPRMSHIAPVIDVGRTPVPTGTSTRPLFCGAPRSRPSYPSQFRGRKIRDWLNASRNFASFWIKSSISCAWSWPRAARWRARTLFL